MSSRCWECHIANRMPSDGPHWKRTIDRKNELYRRLHFSISELLDFDERINKQNRKISYYGAEPAEAGSESKMMVYMQIVSSWSRDEFL